MQETGSGLVAHYYFDCHDSAKRDVRGLLASLLIQLGDLSRHCWDVLYHLYTSCHDGSEQPSFRTLAKCLYRMLRLLKEVPVFIIIDALDECRSNTGHPSAREKVLVLVEHLIRSKLSTLHICITSRAEQDIRAVLGPLTSASRRISLHEEPGQREDINSYIHSFVHRDRTMRRWRREDKALVIDTLSKRADGM